MRKKKIEIVSDRCKTLYPILMVHGIGYRDNWLFRYWGRIPRLLEANGATIFYGDTDAWGTARNNAIVLKNKIDEIIEQTGAEKVNIITHSKGGIDARYMISGLGMADRVASLSTISAPHHGSKSADIFGMFPKWIRRFIAFFPNLWFRICGDKKPDFFTVMEELTSNECLSFNNANPDAGQVYYQSFATVMKHFCSDIFMVFPYLMIKLFEGDNDGLVTPASATWANFRGIIQSASGRGISHADSVDMRRRRFTKKKAEGKYSDITDFYIEIVEELKTMGF